MLDNIAMRHFAKNIFLKIDFLLNQDTYAIKYDHMVENKDLIGITNLLKIAKNTDFIKKSSRTVIPHSMYLLRNEKNHEFTKELINLLISYKANINETELNNENTTHYALISKDLSLIEYILDLNADIHQQYHNKYNTTQIPSAFIKFFSNKIESTKETVAILDFLRDNIEKYNISFTHACFTQRPMGFITLREAETPLNISINFQNYTAIEYLLIHRKALNIDLEKCKLGFKNINTNHPKYSTEELLAYFKNHPNDRIQLIVEKIALSEENKEHLIKSPTALKL